MLNLSDSDMKKAGISLRAVDLYNEH